MGYSKQITVPDRSGDMSVNATVLDASNYGQSGATRLSVTTAVGVWIMHAPSSTPSAADVVAGGSLISLSTPIQLLAATDGSSPPNLSQFFLATVTGAGDVRAIAG